MALTRIPPSGVSSSTLFSFLSVALTATTVASSTTTGALTVAGGLGLGGDLYVGGTINVPGGISGAASQVNTIKQTSNAGYFLTFVDSNNNASAAETLYTSSTIVVNPSTGSITANTFVGNLTGTASSASYATLASTATYAQYASSSSYATLASTATYAQYASSATYSTLASTATYAQYASSSTYATYSAYGQAASSSTYAQYASSSTYATNASTATYAQYASSSSYATLASTATYVQYASSSSYATLASTATYVQYASSATYATYAGNAATANKVNNALTAGTGLVGILFDGSSAQTWEVNTSTLMLTASNLAGGSAGQFVYQTAPDTTAFISTTSMYVYRATVADSANGSSGQINTIRRPDAGTYYLTFVDSNNSSATAEYLYTTGSVFVNPGTGAVGIGHISTGSRLTVNGRIESMTDPASEGGQVVLRGKNWYRWSIDNYNDTFRIIREDDVTEANGLTALSITTSTNPAILIGATTPYSGERLSVNGGGYFNGIVTATTFVGNLTGTASSATYATNASTATYAQYASSSTYAQYASQAQSVTNSVTFNNSNSGDASGTTFNGSTARTISANTLGALSLSGGGTVTGAVTFSGPITFSGTATYSQSTNTYFTDNIVELHVPPGGIGSTWSADDGKDVGYRMHYFNRSTNADANAALILAADSQFLEYYQTGSEDVNGVFTGTSFYGVFKTGNMIAARGMRIGSYSNTTATVVGEKLYVSGGIYSTGIVTATTFVGAMSQSLSAGTGLTGSAYNGSTAQTWTLNTATLMNVSLNLAGGSAGSLPYQSGANATTFLGIGTNGYVLTSNGSAPVWSAASGITAGNATSATYATYAGNAASANKVNNAHTAGTGLTGSTFDGSSAQTWSLNTATLMATAVTAINLSAGSAMALPYQSASGTTAYLSAGTSGYILQTNGTGSAPSWVAASGLSAGSSTNADNLKTIMQPASASYYPSFVDSNNSTAAYEAHYTTSSFYINPASGEVTAAIFAATNNGNGTNFKVGDDAWIGDVNQADTMVVKGQQNAANGYIIFGNGDTTSKLGRSSTGPLTYNGYTVVHGGNTSTTYVYRATVADSASSSSATALTNTYVGYGNGSNLLTGSAALTFDGTVLSVLGGSSNGYIKFAQAVGTKLRFYDASTDKYGIDIQSSELRIYSGAQGASTGGTTIGKYDGTTFTEYFRFTNSGGFAVGGSSNYGSSGQILQSNGNAAPTWVNASSITAGSASLTSTYVGFGSGSNTLTGSSSLTWNGSTLAVSGALTTNSITLPQNTVGTTYAGVSTQPTYYIGQTTGDNDAWKIYGESPSGTNTGALILQSEDDYDGNESIRLRFKRTYSPYNTTDILVAQYNQVYINGTFQVGYSSAQASAALSVNGGTYVGGTIVATGEITAYYSDRRLKTDVITIEDALVKVKSLTGVIYRPNELAKSYGLDSESDVVGLFADEVAAVLPQAVKPAPFDLDETGNSKSGENYKTIQYEKIVPLLIEAIKEQQAIIEEQHDKIYRLMKHLGLE